MADLNNTKHDHDERNTAQEETICHAEVTEHEHNDKNSEQDESTCTGQTEGEQPKGVNKVMWEVSNLLFIMSQN